MLDSLRVRKLQQAVTAAILDTGNCTSAESLPVLDTDIASEDARLLELAIVLNSASKNRISHIRNRSRVDFAPIEFSHHEVRTFGAGFLR